MKHVYFVSSHVKHTPVRHIVYLKKLKILRQDKTLSVTQKCLHLGSFMCLQIWARELGVRMDLSIAARMSEVERM